MNIKINNLEFSFNNVLVNNQNILFDSESFDQLKKLELKTLFVEDLLKSSLRSYVNFNNSLDKSIELIIEYLTYFNLTTNNLVKRDMISKISNILIFSKDYKLIEQNYNVKKKIVSYPKKHDRYYIFLLLMFKHSNKQIYEILDFKDDDTFDFLDFILDD